MEKRSAFLVVNGPNLNLLGEREPSVYGNKTLHDLEKECLDWASQRKVQVDFFQSNSEGVLIDFMQKHRKSARGIVLNAGAYTHYSYAIRDCIASIDVPIVEVHLSKPEAREQFRHISLLSPVVAGKIAGFGFYGYIMALDALMYMTVSSC